MNPNHWKVANRLAGEEGSMYQGLHFTYSLYPLILKETLGSRNYSIYTHAANKKISDGWDEASRTGLHIWTPEKLGFDSNVSCSKAQAIFV
jgi:hypothetical protein